MRFPSFLLFALFASSCFVGFGSQANAQEFKKAMRDYRHEPVFNYQADDPATRSKMFKLHTGHYGKFYNCDGQEDKRYSPYICWKTHHEKNFPSKMGFRQRICHDIAEVKQRLLDGAGCCPVGCECNQCLQAAPVQRSCSCADCMTAAQTSTTSAQLASVKRGSFSKANPTGTAPILSDNVSWEYTESAPNASSANLLHTPKFGLVSGKILNVQVDDKRVSSVTRSYQSPIATQSRTQAPPARLAKEGMADFWSALKR